jgi:lipopolysaccharide transport system ATP-binding protein
MCSEPAIRVEGLSKAYLIYREPRDRLRQAVMPRLNRLLRRLGLPREDRAYYTEHWALSGLSFEVARGETLAVIGRNGSGKSTLLQLICGTLNPTTGRVTTRGRVAALLELGSGFNPEYTGRENVLLNASVLGLTREETLARMDEILAFADIGAFVDQPVKTYSSGMAMRLAFAVIAHVDADVLIVDEALAVGDALFQQKCFRWLRAFQERGTLLFCGHDMGAVVNLCQRAIWLDRGRLRMEGTAKEVAEAYQAFNAASLMGLTGLPVGGPSFNETPAADEETAGWVAVSPEAALASPLARITHLRLARPHSREPVGVVIGSEELELGLRIRAAGDVDDLLIGFVLTDRLGQKIVAATTGRMQPVPRHRLEAGSVAEATLRFRLPGLATGTYLLTPAIASGSQESHVTHHWAQDALAVEVANPYHAGALVTVSLAEAVVERRPV